MDIFTVSQRSRIMARIRGSDTKPERAVQEILRQLRIRFRTGGCGLPGRPDFVLARRRTVLFVHGCFWHGHSCKGGHRPKTNSEYWHTKLDRNAVRDRKNSRLLRKHGWKVITVWECKTANEERLKIRLGRMLAQLPSQSKD